MKRRSFLQLLGLSPAVAIAPKVEAAKAAIEEAEEIRNGLGREAAVRKAPSL